MSNERELEYLRSKQGEDFQLLDYAAVRLAGYGLELELVELNRDCRIETVRFSIQARLEKGLGIKDGLFDAAAKLHAENELDRQAVPDAVSFPDMVAIKERMDNQADEPPAAEVV